MTAPEVQGLAIFPDGSHVCLWKDLDRTVRELERISQREAQGFLEFGIRLQRFGRLMKPFLFRADPPKRSEVMKAFEDAGETELYNEFMLASTNGLVEKYFSSDHVRGLLTFLGLVSVWAGPDTPEGAYLYGYHAIGEFEDTIGRWAFVKGGMGGITQALARAAESQGVEIRVNATVSEIIVEGGHVGGVRLASGEELKAVVVVSNAHPKLTFLKLLQPRHLTSRFKEAVERIDTKGARWRASICWSTSCPTMSASRARLRAGSIVGSWSSAARSRITTRPMQHSWRVSSRTSWQWSLSSNRFPIRPWLPRASIRSHWASSIRRSIWRRGTGTRANRNGATWSARTCFAMRPTSGIESLAATSSLPWTWSATTVSSAGTSFIFR
jgi:hypothetical protein